MIKKCILIISMALLIAPACIHGQSFAPDVIGSAGAYTSTAAGSMAWTIGEVITETGSAGGNSFTQGFQQPDSVIFTGIPSQNVSVIAVYPNPVVDNLLVSIPASSGNYSVEIFNMEGQLLQQQNVASSDEKSFTISFAGFSNGIYLVNILNTNANLKSSYKINKVN